MPSSGPRLPVRWWMLSAFVLSSSSLARANPPRDDFLNPQEPGSRLTAMPFVGPGFRAIYDQRIELEEEVSELRLQGMTTVSVPFAEASAHIDIRVFLMTFGASIGYHQEWRLLQFQPDPGTGRDRAGQPEALQPPARSLPPGQEPLPPYEDPTTTFVDLDRSARNIKDQTGDVQTGGWPFYEARCGFLWPGQGFMGVGTVAARHDDRPDVSYDWENATVYSSGVHLRGEGYFLLRKRNWGFIGPAARALYVPRHRVAGLATAGPYGIVIPEGSACQTAQGAFCARRYEFDLAYGFLAGMRPGWTTGTDAFLVRVYAAWGFDDRLFGLHTLGQPLQLLVAYMTSLDL